MGIMGISTVFLCLTRQAYFRTGGNERGGMVEKELFERYIREVTSCVQFRFDRRAIRQELLAHM